MDALPLQSGTNAARSTSRAETAREPQSTPGARDAISAGPIILNLATYLGSIAGEPLTLTKSEFDLLAYLIRYQDRVLTLRELGRDVFGTSASTAAQLVRVHICHLRRALGYYQSMVLTVRGRGYRLVRNDTAIP